MKKQNFCQFRISKTREQSRRNQNIISTLPSEYTRYSKTRNQNRNKQTLLSENAISKDNFQYLLSNVCSELNFNIPKENKSSTEMLNNNLEKIKNDKIRIACLQHQYILIRKNIYKQEIEESFINIINKIKFEIQKNSQLCKKNQEKQIENHKLREEIIKIKKKTVVMKEKVNDPEPKENYKLIMQNQKLALLNQQLARKIKDMTPLEIESIHESKKDIEYDRIYNQVQDLKDRIKYLTIKLNNQQQNNVNVIKKNQQLTKSINQLTQNNQQLKLHLENNHEQLNQWRQRALMQKQDTQAHSLRQQYFVYSIKKLTQLNKKLTNRVIKTSEDKKQIRLGQKNQLLFNYEVDFFKGIRSFYDQNKNVQYKFNLKSKVDDLGLEFQNINYQTQHSKVIKAEQIYLSQYSFYKPSFYKFIEHIKSEEEQQLFSRSGEVSRTFIPKMRCIMQSKLNQFLLHDDIQKYTRFPEFVFSWFSRYYFDSDNNCIANLKMKEQKSSAKKFYKDLMNTKLDQSWQIITFREFILEQLSLEELYFYLLCQNMLYRKSNITKQMLYLGQFSILVEYSAVKSILETILSEFESWNINFLIAKMNEKIFVKKGIEYIESGFCLRCLLEYYKIERINRFKYIKTECEKIIKDQTHTLTFPQFLEIFNRFTEVTFQDKIKTYRDCFSVGRGVITPELIFTVCTENKLFLKYLKLKCFYKLPSQTISQKKNETGTISKSVYCLQPSMPYLYVIFDKIKILLEEGSHFNSRVMSTGIQELSSKVEFFKKYFAQTRIINDNSILRCKHFIHFINELMIRIKQINYKNLYEILQDTQKRSSRLFIETDQSVLGELFLTEFNAVVDIYNKSNQIIQWKKKVNQFRLNYAAKKIQRYVRVKFIEPYLQIYNIMFEKVKRAKIMGFANPKKK